MPARLTNTSVHNHTRLRVWQRAHWLASAVARETETLDPVLHPGLHAGVCEAANAIVLHIERGVACELPSDFAQALLHAISMTHELQRQVQRAMLRQAIDGPRAVMLEFEVQDIRRMLHSLRQRVVARLRERART